MRAIDSCLTVGRGQRLGIFSGTGVGKSILLGMMARGTAADCLVIALVGERGREVGDFLRKVLGAEGLRRAGLFFLDSRTTPHSVGEAAAAEMGVPFASRDVFLDNDRTPAVIAGQIDRLIAHALETGTAIAIGHPHPETLTALEEGLPRLREAGVTIVRVSKLVTSQDGEM